jgi:hypothetical protein
LSPHQYGLLFGTLQSNNSVGEIVGAIFAVFFIGFIFLTLLNLFGLVFFYLPALLWHGTLGLGNFVLTGKGIQRPAPEFLPTVLKGYLGLITLGIVGPFGKRFLGLGGSFGGGGAIGRW